MNFFIIMNFIIPDHIHDIHYLPFSGRIKKTLKKCNIENKIDNTIIHTRYCMRLPSTNCSIAVDTELHRDNKKELSLTHWFCGKHCLYNPYWNYSPVTDREIILEFICVIWGLS